MRMHKFIGGSEPLKKALFYSIYFVATLVVTYGVQWVIDLFVMALRFTAADYPPGDISTSMKLIFSTGIPIFYMGCMALFGYIYYAILQNFQIQLNKKVLILFNVFVLICMVAYLNLLIFDVIKGYYF